MYISVKLVNCFFVAKGTLFEGGTRAVSFVHGPRWLGRWPYVNHKLLHITDWMPTLLTLGKNGGQKNYHLNRLNYLGKRLYEKNYCRKYFV